MHVITEISQCIKGRLIWSALLCFFLGKTLEENTSNLEIWHQSFSFEYDKELEEIKDNNAFFPLSQNKQF